MTTEPVHTPITESAGAAVSQSALGPSVASGSPAPALPAAAAPPPLMSRIRTTFQRYFTPVSALTVGAATVILTICILLWEVEFLRPYLATTGAGAAAFLGPIAGIVSPEARRKWLASVMIAALIAGFTWFGARDLDARLDRAAEALHQANLRNADYLRAFETVLKEANPEAQNAFMIPAGRLCRQLYRSGQYQAVLDLALLILSVQPNNGHGLYFAGEAHREKRDGGDMVGRFQNYLAQADHDPDAKLGDWQECYKRPTGFCAERTGWIHHLLANEFIAQSASQAPDARQQSLWDAYKQERLNLSLYKWARKEDQADEQLDPGQGFRLQGTAKSSCELLRIAERELAKLGQEVTAIRQTRLEKLPKSCGDAKAVLVPPPAVAPP